MNMGGIRKGRRNCWSCGAGIDEEGKIVAWESKASGFTGPQWNGSLLGPSFGEFAFWATA